MPPERKTKAKRGPSYLLAILHDKKDLIEVCANSHFLDKNNVVVAKRLQQFDFTERRYWQPIALSLHPDPFERHNFVCLFVLGSTVNKEEQKADIVSFSFHSVR